MKATLRVEDHEVSFDMPQEMLDKLTTLFPDLKKTTGYERAGYGKRYYFADNESDLDSAHEDGDDMDATTYEVANYYTDENLAKNNIRADALMRKLRRFSAEHRDEMINFQEYAGGWFGINYTGGRMTCESYQFTRHPGTVYFDTRRHCQQALDEFHDELMWYFTEYRDTAEAFV